MQVEQLIHHQGLLPQEDVVGWQPVNVDEGVIIAAKVCQVAGHSTPSIGSTPMAGALFGSGSMYPPGER